jgi:hypothetical protein
MANARGLLVIDVYDADEVASLTRDGEWDVLMLGISESWFRLVAPSLPPSTGRLAFVDGHECAAEAHEQVRAFVLEAWPRLSGSVISGASLADRLTALGSSWWYLETAEKAPYRTPLIFQLYWLALLELVGRRREYRRIVVATSRRWLADVLERGRLPMEVKRLPPAPDHPTRGYWRGVGGAVASVLLTRLAGWLARWPEEAGRGGAWIFSFLPAWWTGVLDARYARDRFFSAPPDGVRGVSWLSGVWAWRERRALKSFIAERRIAVLQRYVPVRALVQLLSPARLYAVARVRRHVRRLAGFPFAGVDVAPLLADDVSRSLTSGELPQDQLIEAASARFAKTRRPECILYRAEFQPPEFALLIGLTSIARTVGFVHYPFGRRYLPVSGAQDRPAPSAMIACGDAGRRHLVESGYPPSQIALCGPQRHVALLEYLSRPRDRNGLRRQLGVDTDLPAVLVATALAEEDTEALFGALIQVLPSLGPCRVLVRTHPNRPAGDAALARALEALGSDRATRVGAHVSLYETIEASDVLVTIGSTVAFEAMALGCQPVLFEAPATYAATSLVEFEDAIYIARDPETLRVALSEVLSAAPPARARRRRWTAAVASTLGDLEKPLDSQLTRALAELSFRLDGSHASTSTSTGTRTSTGTPTSTNRSPRPS